MSETINNCCLAVSARQAFSIFRVKISFICGECQAPQTACGVNEIVRASNYNNRLACHCKNCGTWNMTEFVQTD